MSSKFPTVDWLRGAGIYEVNIRQYTQEGTFNAFAKFLPMLQETGVQVLWFMPITPISQKNRKGTLGSYYACSSYTAINPEYGTKEDFKSLVDEAHSMGFKVIIDWVANHTGWDHEWTQHPDWYRKDDQGNFTEIHGWDDVIDLNYDNMEMQTAMIDAMKYWIGNFDLDGFRCDMAHLVALPFWAKARQECEQIKPLMWLGECDEDDYSEVFDLTYSWKWMHATEHFAKGDKDIAEIKGTMNNYLQLPPGAQKLYFTSNHDENSWNGTEYEKYGASLARALAVLTCFIPGAPLIYSGQELPNLKRLKFFDKDQIEWPADHTVELGKFYHSLLEIRKTNKELFDGGAQFKWLNTQSNKSVLAYYLEYNQLAALVLINLHPESPEIPFKLNNQLSESQLKGTFSELWKGADVTLHPDNEFLLAPCSPRIFIKKQ